MYYYLSLLAPNSVQVNVLLSASAATKASYLQIEYAMAIGQAVKGERL